MSFRVRKNGVQISFTNAKVLRQDSYTFCALLLPLSENGVEQSLAVGG
jgi:hypothetical protein